MIIQHSNRRNASEHSRREAPTFGLGVPGTAGISNPSSQRKGSGIVALLECTAWQLKDIVRWKPTTQREGTTTTKCRGGLYQQFALPMTITIAAAAKLVVVGCCSAQHRGCWLDVGGRCLAAAATAVLTVTHIT